MRNYFLSLICLMVAVFAIPGFGEIAYERGYVDPLVFRLGKVKPFEIDGKFEHGKYSISSNLAFPNTSGLRIGLVNFAWGLAHDGERITIGVTSPTGGALKATQNDRDANLWEDDVYEMFFLSLDGKKGIHLIVNSGKGIYDSALAGSVEHSDWNPEGIVLKNQINGKDWSCELSMPLALLKEQIGDISNFKFALYRSSLGKRPNEGITQHTGMFFEPENFAVVCLDGNEQKVHCITNEKALAGCELKFHLAGIGFDKAKGNVKFTLLKSKRDYGTYDAYNKSIENTVAAKDFPPAQKFAYDIPVDKLQDAGMLHIVVAQGKEIVFERKLTFDTADFAKLSIASLYMDAPHKNICAEVTLPASGNAVNYTYGIKDMKGAVLAQKEKTAQGSTRFTFPLDGLKPDRYQFFVSSPAKVEDSGTFAVLPEKPEWLGNQLGMTNGKAPAPWTDIQVKGDTASVWSGDIVFKGMPVAFNTRRGCVANNLRFLADGKTMKNTKFQWTKIAGDKAQFQSDFDFDGGVMRINGCLEFDGLLWLDCAFKPSSKGATLPDVVFLMDIPEGNGRYVYTSEHNANNSGVLPPDKTWKKNMLRSKATWWVGTPEKGIYFVADDLRGWNIRNYAESVTIGVEKNGVRTARMQLLDKAINKPDTEYRLEFALQPTPTRPMPKGWRTFEINGGMHHNLRVYQVDLMKYYNVPVPLMSYANANMDMWWKKNVNPLPYLAFLCTSPFTDEFKCYSEQWLMKPQARPPVKPENFWTYSYICPRGEAYNDFYLWKLNQMFDQLHANGLYFDFAQPSVYLCSNQEHGCGWKDTTGTLQPSLRIKACRELIKRIYVLLKQRKPDGILALHDSGGRIPAFHCFADLCWNGEQQALNVFNNGASYKNLYPDQNKVLLEQDGEIFGVGSYYIPQFVRVLQLWSPNVYGPYSWKVLSEGWNADPTSLPRAVYLAGMLYVNGGDFSADYGEGRVLREMSKLKEEIGWGDDAIFHGWYNANSPFKLQAPSGVKTLVSSYEAKKGTLLVLFNDLEEDRDFAVSVPENLRSKQFLDYLSKENFTITDGKLHCPMKAHSARMLQVR